MQVIESVGGRKGTDDEDDETSYTSKGPIQQRRALGHQNRAAPYMNIQANPAAAQMGGAPPPPAAPIVTVKQEINTQTQEMGHFIDDPTLLSTLMVDTSSSQPQSPKVSQQHIHCLPILCAYIFKAWHQNVSQFAPENRESFSKLNFIENSKKISSKLKLSRKLIF